MTFAPVMLIGVSSRPYMLALPLTDLCHKKYGTRRLLLASIIGSLFSTLLLGYGLDTGLIWLSSVVGGSCSQHEFCPSHAPLSDYSDFRRVSLTLGTADTRSVLF